MLSVEGNHHIKSSFKQVLIYPDSTKCIECDRPYYSFWAISYFHSVHGIVQVNIPDGIVKQIDLIITMDQPAEPYANQTDEQAPGVQLVKQFQCMPDQRFV
jgi:hypothetical protein